MSRQLIGIDIGGTKIEAKLFSLASESDSIFEVPKTLWSRRIKTQRLEGIDFLLKNLCKLLETLLQENNQNIKNIEGIGIGLPGSIDPISGKMLQGNTAIFVGVDIKSAIHKHFNHNIKIHVYNDANSFALAEDLFGAGLKHRNLNENLKDKNRIGIGIILGTGLGGGVIINGTPLVGKNGGGAELGHTNFINNGLACYCGKNGCAEQYLSGSAIESTFNARKYSKLTGHYCSSDIFKLAQDKEPLALAIIKQYRSHLSDFIANMTNIFDPDYFVLGGGVSKQEAIYFELEQNVSKKTFLKESNPMIYKNELGDSSGALGTVCGFLNE